MEIEQGTNTIERRLFAIAEDKRIPINGSLELLPLCNFNCDMCYVRLSKEEVEKQGRIHTGEEWLSLGKQLVDAGVTFLLLTGGEPLLHPDFKEIYVGLKKMGFVITINTNGSLINEEWATFFGQNKPRRINITLYGSSNETYKDLCHNEQYDNVIKGIQLLRQNDVDVRVGATVAKKNMKDLPEIIHMSEALDSPVNVDTYLQPSVRERLKPFDEQSRMTPKEMAYAHLITEKLSFTSEEYHSYLENMIYQIEHYQPVEPINYAMSCLAARCSFTINWQGKLRPCVILNEPEMSVFEHSFEECWNHIVSNTENIELNHKCATCKYRPVCRTCAAAALYETGSYQGIPEYLCQYTHALYEQMKKELNQSLQ